MERTDIYFAAAYMVRYCAYFINKIKNSSDVKRVVADTDSMRVSIYGGINADDLNQVLAKCAEKGYKHNGLITIQL